MVKKGARSISVVDCGDPGSVDNAVREELSGQNNYSIGAQVEYTCGPGYYIAKERDAIGNLIVGEADTIGARLTCTANGRWLPRRANIHCSGECVTMRCI